MNRNNNQQWNKSLTSIAKYACFSVYMPTGVYADTTLFSCDYFNSC